MNAVPRDVDDRAARAARNQSLFREVNERMQELNETFSEITIGPGDWVCECANESCIELARLTVEEYEAVRAKPNRFFVMPDDAHVWPEVEQVVERTDRYWIVEKYGPASVVAAEADPRGRG